MVVAVVFVAIILLGTCDRWWLRCSMRGGFGGPVMSWLWCRTTWRVDNSGSLQYDGLMLRQWKWRVLAGSVCRNVPGVILASNSRLYFGWALATGWPDPRVTETYDVSHLDLIANMLMCADRGWSQCHNPDRDLEDKCSSIRAFYSSSYDSADWWDVWRRSLSEVEKWIGSGP